MRRLCLLPALALLACTLRPGAGVSPDFATNWGCNHARIEARADTLSEQLPSGRYYVPQVGWSACDVMAHIGAPQEVDIHSSRYGRSADWWYGLEDYEGPTLVSLQLEGGRWVVTYTSM